MTSFLIVLSLLTICGLLYYGFFHLLIYYLKRENYKHFKHKYIEPFSSSKHSPKYDLLTGDLFKEGELIVNKCNQVISLASWEFTGRQCLNYPDCMHQHPTCNGNGMYIEQIDRKPVRQVVFLVFGIWLIFVLLSLSSLSNGRIVWLLLLALILPVTGFILFKNKIFLQSKIQPND